MKLDKQRFICLDCETNGLDAKQNRIIEIAIILFDFYNIYESFETLIDPEQEISASSLAIHHITPEMVKGKPTIKEVLPKILPLVGQNIIIGHGVGFDIDILTQSAQREGLSSNIHYN